MAQSFIAELGDRLGGQNVENTEGGHVKTIAPVYYTRTDNNVVTHPSIQDAIDGLSSPKVKNRKTIIRHTITATDVTNQSAQFEDPILMPSGYGSKTVAFVNLTGTITTDDTSGVTNAYMIALDFNAAHSFGTNTYSVNFVVQPDVQVNFESNTQVQLSGGTMHPDGLYLEIYRHGLPAGSSIAVTAEVTVLDRE